MIRIAPRVPAVIQDRPLAPLPPTILDINFSPPGIDTDHTDLNSNSSDDVTPVSDQHIDDLDVPDQPFANAFSDFAKDRDYIQPLPLIEPMGVNINPVADLQPIPQARIRQPPSRLGEWIYPVDCNSYAFVAQIDIPNKPKTYAEAMASPRRIIGWQQCMKSMNRTTLRRLKKSLKKTT